MQSRRSAKHNVPNGNTLEAELLKYLDAKLRTLASQFPPTFMDFTCKR
jgi:hypothetical protein